MLKFSGAVIWRLGTRTALGKYFSSSATVIKADKSEDSGNLVTKSTKNEEDDIQNTGLVAAAFASLTSPELPPSVKKPSSKSVKLSKAGQLDAQIAKAQDVEHLLVVAENPIISRRHALKMVSVLSEWSSSNKVQLSEFEKDPRFLKLCRILARTPTSQAINSLNMADDLSTVLGITGDDEAARLIANLTLPQMIKVMKALNQKGRRSTPLLRALSHNIVKQEEPIDLKKSADLLFSMAALNFPDPVLLDRICSDVTALLPSNEDKSAVVNSIVVSLGLLKYRHEACLGALTRWVTQHRALCRAGDLASAVVTLATVDYVPDMAGVLLQTTASLKEEDLTKPSAWVDLVFSLLILNSATVQHLSSTLRPEFIEKLLASGEIPIPARRKLMAIDAYLSLAHPKYAGPRLPEEISVGVPLLYTREKSLFVQSVLDTFRNLVSADSFLKKDCNSNMGFLYDGEFALDAKCHPVPLDKALNNKRDEGKHREESSTSRLSGRVVLVSGDTVRNLSRVFRIAVLSLDYHDLCRKSTAPLGIYKLYTRLLELKGFNVLQIPYTEFNPKDKLITRVQYIEKRLKEIVSSKPAS